MGHLLGKLKLLAKVALGAEFLVKPDIACATERFGSEYGGWQVITSGIDRNSIVYSFGVGEDASFDIGLIERFDLTVFAFDPTPRSIQWVATQKLPESFVMHPFGIAAFDGDVKFNPPDNPEFVSHTVLDRPSTEEQAITVPVRRLSTILRELGHDRIDVLKMDIEGAEYDVLDEMKENDIRPNQILIEFHHRFQNVGVEKSKSAIEQIRSMGYDLFAVSSSNEEFCFARRATLGEWL